MNRLAGPVTAATLMGVLAASPAAGYRFYPVSRSAGRVPDAAAALRWDASSWAPEQSREWVLVDPAAWTAPWTDADGRMQEPTFSDVSEITAIVEEALDRWARIPSAEIQWSLAGTAEGPGTGFDGESVLVYETGFEEGIAGQAIWWSRNGEIMDCDILLSPNAVNNLDDWGRSTLVHEFGHCLGLAHAALFPTWDASWFRRGFGDALWPEDPQMSYGYGATDALSADDIVGASLLRPAPGWAESTGTVRGTVEASGAPARYARVVATRMDAGSGRVSVGAFTDRGGEYRIEGLPPGSYLLAAGPVIAGDAHPRLLERGALSGVADAYGLVPLVVRRGRETTAPPLLLLSGRPRSFWRGR